MGPKDYCVNIDVVPPRANEGGFFMSIVTSEGGLTILGYALSILAIIVLILAATWLYSQKKSSRKLSTKQLVFCSVSMALAFVASYIKIVNFPLRNIPYLTNHN